MDWLDKDITVAELATHLSGLSTRQLAQVLARRDDLADVVRPDGMLDAELWPLRPKLGAIACVDGVAIRRNPEGVIEGGVIRRKTGKFPGKLAFIGGAVGKNESIEAAMKRHWKTDLGLEIELPMGWDYPVFMRQYAPQVDGRNRFQFCWDPGKHSYASTHIVLITSDPNKVALGNTEYGGQEASRFDWYSLATCPPESEWSYNMGESFGRLLLHAEALYKMGKLRLPLG